MSERVAILGASHKPDRYAHRALVALRQHGHQPLLVAPNLREIEGLPVVARLTDLSGPVHTVTVYVGPATSNGLIDDLVALRPGRVIFNPGAENPTVAAALDGAGIAHENSCTLVLLATGRF